MENVHISRRYLGWYNSITASSVSKRNKLVFVYVAPYLILYILSVDFQLLNVIKFLIFRNIMILFNLSF